MNEYINDIVYACMCVSVYSGSQFLAAVLGSASDSCDIILALGYNYNIH